ncbi:unnamed protein product [Meganyctiphanes norvegica]|uniref:Uncharacterized protein n=1 Tax=Meganyctiphanes norvegica TaxID=48144 RepID=A0AAV2RX16_MEGNR
MSDKSKWKRKLPTRIYDYNFKVSEGYYAPQTEFIETRPLQRTKVAPPEHASYAERFSSRPWYGGVKGLPYHESESVYNQPILRPRSASMSRLSTPTRTFEYDDDEPVYSSRLSRGRSRLGSVSRLDDDDLYTPNDLHNLDVKEELRSINEKLHSAKMKPGLPVCPRSYVDTPRITQAEWRRRNKYLPMNDPSSTENVMARPPLPPSSSTFRRSSISFETKFESNNPVSLRSHRGASVGSVTFDDDDEDIDFSSTFVRKPRSRNISFSDSTDMPPRPPSTNRLIEERKHFNAQQMADARRLQASEELTGYIDRKLGKLKNLSTAPPRDVEVPYKTAFSNRIRASSLGPSGYNNTDSTESRPRNFCWGYCK